jgi:Tfp pilus assembly PilM family ATPase
MIRNFTSVTKQYNLENNLEAYVIVENNIKSTVPLDEANTDYQAIQEWAAIEGNNIIDPGA